MATRRTIKSVLWSFLGTYVSRYSDYNGYWLFGFIVADLDELRINLLGQDVSDPASPTGAAVLSAVTKFEEQRQKSDLAPSHIHEAWLTIQKLPGEQNGWASEHWSAGFNVRFLAVAVMDNGKRYERECVVFVAAHNPDIERRSGRAAKPSNHPGFDGIA